MQGYLIAFLCAVACDAVPAFAPPSWVALVYVQLRLGLNVPLVALAGVLGSMAGRLILTTYVHKAAKLILSRHEERNIKYLGKVLGKSRRADFLFVFLYCLTPLSTSPLFLGAAMADVRRDIVFPPFFLGKLLCYGFILYAGERVAPDIAALAHGKLSWQGILVALFGLSMVFGMLFIDWHALLHDRKLRFNFDVARFGAKSGAVALCLALGSASWAAQKPVPTFAVTPYIEVMRYRLKGVQPPVPPFAMQGLLAMRSHGEGDDVIIEAKLTAVGLGELRATLGRMMRFVALLAKGAKVTPTILSPAMTQNAYHALHGEGWPEDAPPAKP